MRCNEGVGGTGEGGCDGGYVWTLLSEWHLTVSEPLGRWKTLGREDLSTWTHLPSIFTLKRNEMIHSKITKTSGRDNENVVTDWKQQEVYRLDIPDEESTLHTNSMM